MSFVCEEGAGAVAGALVSFCCCVVALVAVNWSCRGLAWLVADVGVRGIFCAADRPAGVGGKFVLPLE